MRRGFEVEGGGDVGNAGLGGCRWNGFWEYKFQILCFFVMEKRGNEYEMLFYAFEEVIVYRIDRLFEE